MGMTSPRPRELLAIYAGRLGVVNSLVQTSYWRGASVCTEGHPVFDGCGFELREIDGAPFSTKFTDPPQGLGHHVSPSL
tara:strand:+ start:103 stop:339 length:237 start_codon:yes stop_codon:yes gene_type:complete